MLSSTSTCILYVITAKTEGFFSMVYQYKTSSDEDHIIFLLSVFPFLNQHKKNSDIKS